MKGRFSATDVRAMVRDLRSSVLGQRVVNVYDLDAKVSNSLIYTLQQTPAQLLIVHFPSINADCITVINPNFGYIVLCADLSD
jgi:predicted ribosome quality control (RQC) complex YloA/Tae2 family protein